jgi:formylglycine-generating enzyme required for sulfatase activity
MILASSALAADAPLTKIDSPDAATKAQAAAASVAGKPVEFTNSVGMKFRLIPAGEFVMGHERGEPDAPPRVVKVTRPFYISVTEITRAQFEAVTGKKQSNFYPGADLPMNHVSWYHIDEFFGALAKKEEGKKYRLPSEAEWELAARAGESSVPDLSKVAWDANSSKNAPHPVAQKAANAFGLFDTLGNVWEWCEDFYDKDYYRFGPSIDPTGPTITISRYKVVRGGSFMSDPRACDFAHRDFFQESRTTKDIGFRVVLPL